MALNFQLGCINQQPPVHVLLYSAVLWGSLVQQSGLFMNEAPLPVVHCQEVLGS